MMHDIFDITKRAWIFIIFFQSFVPERFTEGLHSNYISP